MAKRNKTTLKQIPTDQSAPSNFLKKWSWIFFALGVLLYANTWFHDYAVDDAIVIYDNEFTTKGIAGIPNLLKYDTFRGFFKVEGKDNLVSGGRYRPLTPVMYAAEVQLFSPKKKDENGQVVKDKDGDEVFDPNENGELNMVKIVGHFINTLLYGLTCVVLFLVMLQLLSPNKKINNWDEKAALIAIGTTLLFLAHPIHTEGSGQYKRTG